MAHSPCSERRVRREMEGQQDGKILSQPVNLYEVHKEPKKWMVENAASAKKAEIKDRGKKKGGMN